MSEVSGGPGWWQASDGKWYPPESRPASPTAFPPPSVSGPGPSPGGDAPASWWRKWWWVPVVGAVVVIGGIGSLADDDSPDDSRGGPSGQMPAESDGGDVSDSRGGVAQDDLEVVTSSSPPPATATTVPLGSRERPFPVGEAATFTVRTAGDADDSVWSLVVDEPGTDITRLVADENMFNPDPDDGSLYFGVPISLTLVEADKEPLATFFNIEFEFMGKATLSISDMGFFGCGVLAGEFDETAEVFIGGTLSGLLCVEVSEQDYEAGLLLTLDSIDEGRVFLEAGPSPDGVADDRGGEDSTGSTTPTTTAGADGPSSTVADSEPAAAPPKVLLPGDFSYLSPRGDEGWDGSIVGFVVEEAGGFSDDGEQCVVVMGTMTATVVDDDGLTTDLTGPPMSVLADGRLVESNVFACAATRAEDAGYMSKFMVEVTAGSTMPFYAGFPLPAGTPEPQMVEVVVGDTDEDGYLRVPTETLDVIPPATYTGVPLSASAVLPIGSVITHESRDGVWEVQVTGVTILDATRAGGGSCAIVVGTMTPTDIGDALISDGSDAPNVGVVVNGLRRSSDFLGCEDAAARSAGYQDPIYADVAVGTPFAFYDATFVPADQPRQVDAVAIGLIPFQERFLVAASQLDDIPPARG